MQSAAKRAGFFTRTFPAPNFLLSRSVSIDISDASIKWVALSRPGQGSRKVEAWGQEPLSEGIVAAGVIRDAVRLTEALQVIKQKMPHISAAHAALPEEPAFVFGLSAPANSTREQLLSMIEFEFEARVPIPPSAAVYDFDFIPGVEAGMQEIGVTVFPRDIAESYADCFERAGFSLRSLEIEARSIARAAVSRSSAQLVELLVDFGYKRTGFSVLKSGVPIFTSTVEIGGETIDRALMENMKMSQEEAQVWKNEQGLLPEAGAKSPGLEAVSGAASSLGSEVARYFNYWDTRRNDRGERVSPVSRVLLVGGSANMKGLADYIAGRVQAPVERPNVWSNVCSFDEYIPPIERHNSLQYVTAIGLALRD